MEKLKEFLDKNKKPVTIYIFVSIVIAGFNCIERPDFNFLLYFFMYYTMLIEHKNTTISEKDEKKERLLYLITIIFSFLIDFLWIYCYKGYGYGFSMFLSVLGLVLKLPITLIAIVKYIETTKNSVSQDFQEFREDIPF